MKDRLTKSYNNKYTKCSNIILQDDRLSYEAIGIFSYLWSKDDDWEIIVKHLQKRNNTSEYAVRKALRELRQYGYIKWHRIQSGCEYFLSDEAEYINENKIHCGDSQHDDPQHDDPQHDIYIEIKELKKEKNKTKKANPPALNSDKQSSVCDNNLKDLKENIPISKETDENFKKISNLYYGKETCREIDYKVYRKTLNKGISVSQLEEEVSFYINTRANEHKLAKRKILNNDSLTKEQKANKIANIWTPRQKNFETFCNTLDKKVYVYRDKFEETERQLNPPVNKKTVFDILYKKYRDDPHYFTTRENQEEVQAIIDMQAKIKDGIIEEGAWIENEYSKPSIMWLKNTLLRDLCSFEDAFYLFLSKHA